MKIWRILLSLIIVVTLALSIASPVGATALKYEFFTTAGDADSVPIYGANYVAEQFTSNATSHTVSMIRVELLRVGTPSAVKVALYNAAAGVPTTEITSVTYSGTILSTTYTMYDFDITDTSLMLSTQYAIVVSCPSGDNANYIMWHQVNAGGLASAIGSDSANSGVSWTVDAGGADYLFELWGGVVFQVVGANVYKDYLATGDWLVVIDCINDYPVYSGSVDASKYFQVQLLNVAGTSVIAATTLKNWGNAPCAIYLNPTSVLPLTNGAPYIISMIGTFAGAPETHYHLTSVDWGGNDLSYLDTWCLNLANRMHDYDYGVGVLTNPYTTKTSIGGDVLTTYGGGDFIKGIPSIMIIRNDLFESSVTTPDYDTGVASNAYDALHTWQDQVGTTIAGDAAVFGTVFGISAKQFLQLGIWVIYIFALLFIFASSTGAEAIFVMIFCAPILLIGMHFRLIEAYIVAVLAAMAVLLFVIKMWFTK